MVELADLGPFLRTEVSNGTGRGTETDNFCRHLKPLSNYGGGDGNFSSSEREGKKGLHTSVPPCRHVSLLTLHSSALLK